MAPFVLYFLLVSFLVALVTSATRLSDPARIVSETFRFFLTIVVCIAVFSGLVFVLEWIFIRPLI